MGKKYNAILFFHALLILSSIITSRNSFAVPAVPNDSVVVGRVIEYAVTSSSVLNMKPDRTLYSVTLAIESSEGINKGPDFVSNRIGNHVRFYSKEELPKELFGSRIKARVRYAGDERGGRFWIGGIEVIE